MILLIDTAASVCRVGVGENDKIVWRDWQADRELAKGLLWFIKTVLAENDASFTDITGIGVYKGPGSFTGLRIGITVANTLADSLSVSIVGMTGESWAHEALNALATGISDKVVLPEYGAEAHITKPRK